MDKDEDLSNEFFPAFVVLTTNEKLLALVGWNEDHTKLVMMDCLQVQDFTSPDMRITFSLRKWIPLSDDRILDINRNSILAIVSMSEKYYDIYNSTRIRLYETEDGDLKEKPEESVTKINKSIH